MIKGLFGIRRLGAALLAVALAAGVGFAHDPQGHHHKHHKRKAAVRKKVKRGVRRGHTRHAGHTGH